MQSQVDEVIDVMQENISKVIERGERLDDLQDKSGESRWVSACSHVHNMCATLRGLLCQSQHTVHGITWGIYTYDFPNSGKHLFVK